MPLIGCRLSDTFEDITWRDLLRIWERLMDAYTDPIEPDVPYWYGERALTGLLAAAAWQVSDGWSLEEFLGARQSAEKSGAGRGDLWLGFGRTTAYTAEAKVVWPQENSEAALGQIQAALVRAAGQLCALGDEFRVGTPIALCYVVPDLDASRWSESPAELERLFTSVGDSFAGRETLIATYRPPLAKPPVFKGRCYPGLMLIGRTAEWP